MDTPEEKYYTVQELAKELQVSPQTIRKRIKDKTLRCIRVGERTWRIPASSVKLMQDLRA